MKFVFFFFLPEISDSIFFFFHIFVDFFNCANCWRQKFSRKSGNRRKTERCKINKAIKCKTNKNSKKDNLNIFKKIPLRLNRYVLINFYWINDFLLNYQYVEEREFDGGGSLIDWLIHYWLINNWIEDWLTNDKKFK